MRVNTIPLTAEKDVDKDRQVRHAGVWCTVGDFSVWSDPAY